MHQALPLYWAAAERLVLLRRLCYPSRLSDLCDGYLYFALQVPQNYRSPVCWTKWSGMEGLLVLLRRLCYPSRLSDLCDGFRRSKPVLSLIFNTMLMWMWRRWGHLLKDPFTQGFFSAERVATYSTKITEKVSPGLHVWGFIDGTVRPICRPVRDQQQFYNGHKRVHALKYQSVVTPNSIIAHLFGPVEGRRHDAGVLAESGLLQQLAAHMDDPHGVPYALYGDTPYPLSPYLQKAFQGAALTAAQCDFNTRFSNVRIAVEWAFGEISTLWAYIDMKKQQKTLLQPVALYYFVATLFTNLHTIARYGNKTSKFFGVSPPSLNEYLQ